MIPHRSTPQILQRPLAELAAISVKRLHERHVLQRGRKSALYREKWDTAGVQVNEIETYTDFAKAIPYVTSADLRTTVTEYPIEQVVCTEEIVHWCSTTGTTGAPKWIPYAQWDIDLYMEIRDRSTALLPSLQGLKSAAITAPPPFVENALAAFETIRKMQTETPLEGVAVSLTEVDQDEPINFMLDLKPNVLAAFPGFAARMAEIIAEQAPMVAQREWQQQPSVRHLLRYLATRLKTIRPKDLANFTFGLFGGEPLDPYRRVLKQVYGLDPFELYLFTEFLPPTIECRMHDGMHLWMDICLPELIPESELAKEHTDTTYVPVAIPLWQAESGMRGEYVLTTFGDALPLIRYRFGDLIEVVSTQPCGCGITHPRIKVPRRADTTICLGSIRFPASQLDAILLTPTPYGAVAQWQLIITRDGYRPQPLFRIKTQGPVAKPQAFMHALTNQLQSLDILHVGLENKLVAPPRIELVETDIQSGHQVTPSGYVIYEGERS